MKQVPGQEKTEFNSHLLYWNCWDSVTFDLRFRVELHMDGL